MYQIRRQNTATSSRTHLILTNPRLNDWKVVTLSLHDMDIPLPDIQLWMATYVPDDRTVLGLHLWHMVPHHLQQIHVVDIQCFTELD